MKLNPYYYYTIGITIYCKYLIMKIPMVQLNKIEKETLGAV